jgi:hypothetical protein
VSEDKPIYDISQAQAAIAADKQAREERAAAAFPAWLAAHGVDLVVTPIITADGRIGVQARFVAR